jgi:hypothetical protein
MEETDVCYPTPTVRALQQAIPNGCSAKALGPSDRLNLGVQALAGERTVTDLAGEFDVSRKFVYQQAATARDALEEAFASPDVAEDQVLFHLPVTKAWLRQATLGLTLICHSSFRGVHEFWRDLLDYKMSIATVHNILKDAVAKARPYSIEQNLANISSAALDEIFQSRRPVLVGADVASTYCFLLSQEDHRDADTWGVHLLDLAKQGFAPESTIADFGTGIRAGLELALSGTLCRGDVFHVLQELTPLVTYLENRAYDAITAQHKLQHKKTKMQRQARRNQTRQLQALVRKAHWAAQAEVKAVALADDIALLARWLHYDIFAISGLPYAHRCALFDFILAELQAREALCPHRIGPVYTLLKNHRDELLAFAAHLDQDLANVAADFHVPVTIVRELLDLETLDLRQARHWQKEAALRQKLGHRFHHLSQAVFDVAEHAVRASSVIENLNSRLRPYFFLRRQLGPDYLVLLQFFLNHRRFLRSEHPERVDKSPAELLMADSHPHWLEMLGYTRFSRN